MTDNRTTEQTATERLRALLDERGVEWWKPSKDSEKWTHWYGMNDTVFSASEDARGCVWIGASLTPEQAIAATLGSEREKRLEKLVRIYGEIANYFCARFACCDAEFANCKYCIGLPQGGQCELGWCNDESKKLGIEQPDYGGGKCEPVNLEELYDKIGELEELARDMWFWGYEGHMDSESQDWQMKHIDGVLDRMKELGIEVDDVRD